MQRVVRQRWSILEKSKILGGGGEEEEEEEEDCSCSPHRIKDYVPEMYIGAKVMLCSGLFGSKRSQSMMPVGKTKLSRS